MKKENTLVGLLYWFCNISFYTLLLWFVASISIDVFTTDGKIGNFSSGSHHSIGYQMPVKVQISPKKAMYNNSLFKLEKEGINTLGQSYSSGTGTYVKPITSEDSLDFKSIVSIHNKDMVDHYEFTSTQLVSNGFITVNPKTMVNKFLIIVRSYSGLLILLLVFLFLKRIFKALKTNFLFSQKLYKSINLIGILLICYVLLNSIINFILGIDLPYVSISPLDYNLKYVTISMNPRLDFDFVLFLIGFMLLVLSTLLNKGNQIQQENDLTI
ncbi:DUF2975 domain-containing protein [Winogradskyella psychrotolerans]|uniref:DUF2975 domain-containing protein n=1 Tax=Winogradskyella psychrotolerans TaxID=1344585 RepID=UPI001C078284|nr:DUF2975 domain-containing protein [Winogradskyella psychrotolerans]MBU2921821.1 DUF2975 domain-containing protein [Winogradskyella psychrotolerans]